MRQTSRFFSSRRQNGNILPKLLFSLTALMLVIGGVVLWPRTATTELRIDSRTYPLDVANTPAAQAKGLGDRDSMPADRGMLFTYKSPAYLCFWMKDMRFSLDIIWLDSQKKVIKLEQNLSPQTYPQDYCADNTQYVIELNAGQAAAAHLQVGQKLDF